jgi:cell division protein ZipA
MTANELRVVLLIVGGLILFAIWWFGRRPADAPVLGGGRREPVLGAAEEAGEAPAGFPAERSDVEIPALRIDGLSEGADSHEASPQASRGQRLPAQPERIVSLYVVAREGYALHGPDILVAAEKAGMVHGDLGIFHRVDERHADAGPVFSMANMLRPGSFDLAAIDQFSTPGLVLFMTLPGPLPALDAWDRMLPAAQRLAELLGAQLLDDQRTPIGRQRIAALRDELRAWDRQREQAAFRPNW